MLLGGSESLQEEGITALEGQNISAQGKRSDTLGHKGIPTLHRRNPIVNRRRKLSLGGNQ